MLSAAVPASAGDAPGAAPHVSPWQEDGTYNTKELTDWFHTQAEGIGRRFDERNGSHCFGHDLAVSLERK